MSKKLSLISLVKDGSVFVSHAHSRIAGVTAEFYPEVGTFECFPDAKELLEYLSASFSHAKIVIVCAETSRYIYLKKVLFQALSLENEPFDTILGAIAEHSADESSESGLSHALAPKGSTVFLSEDGLFSGFAVKSGKQHLIVLPLDLDRLDSIFENGFTEYLKNAISPNNSSLDAVAEKNIVTSVLGKLVLEHICFAVAANKTSAFIKRRLSATDMWEDSFKFSPCDEEKKNLTQKEFIANLARQAQEKTGCPAGLAISNVYTSEKEDGRMFVLVTVADKLRARVAKVYAQPGESARQLVAAAVETLFTMVSDYVDASGFSGFPVVQENADIPEEEKRDRSRLAVKLVISGLIAAIICILIVLFGSRLVNAVKEYSGKNPATSQAQTIESAFLPGSNESSSESETTQDSAYDPEYLLSLLEQAPSYAASEEEFITETSASTVASAQNTTKNKNTTKYTGDTIKPSTTKQTAVVTTKAASTAATTTTTTTALIIPPQYAGTFSFSVKGYGHGVGMSQEGAKSYARQGWTYDKILLHYYTPGVTLLDDTNLPERVTYGGNSIELIEYLARTVAQEIGTGSPIEALKAQTVAAYTFAKSYGFNVSGGQHAYSTTFNLDLNSNVMKAVNEVAGKYLVHNGSPITAFYFASAAGQTVSSASVWGGTVPYLQGGVSSPESVSQSSKSYSAAEIKAFVDEYNSNPKFSSKKITLQDNPAEWIKIIDADSAGYINTIRVGDQVMRGYSFRQDLFKLRIRSHCFAFTYTSA